MLFSAVLHGALLVTWTNPLEVADVIRAAGPAFIERCLSCFDRRHLKVLNAIQRCRTAALGGHVDECSRCGLRTISYNSCRNRHCPKCQGNARRRWLRARQAELLPVRYVHVVFTLPHELASLALANKKTIYTLLFRLSAETLMEFARDPRLLGAEIGFFSILHTWNQKLQHHPHVHSVVPEGGISPDGSRWVRPRYEFFLPVKAMAKAFRGKFLDALQAALAAGELQFPGQLKKLSIRGPLLHSSVNAAAINGLSTPSGHLAVPNTFFSTWATTRTVSPSPTTD